MDFQTALKDEQGPCKPEPTFNVIVKVESIEYSPEVCTIATRKVEVTVQNSNEKLAVARALIQAGLRLEVELGIQ
jgi:hypothetical protein